MEFQPSGRKGCYLNVGHQHLWVREDHFVFGEPERPLGSSVFVAFEGDSQDFSRQMARAAGLAADAAARRRLAHGEGTDALRDISSPLPSRLRRAADRA